ncbi:hypothetical protein GBA52_014407 [Prunus armeniaca]|nr:hypothetical protein GBA52_014407 [Prunus armeniaca]
MEACPVYCWRSQDLGEYLSSSFKFSYMHWWLMLWFNHFYQLKLPIYTFTWRWLFICLQVHQFSHCYFSVLYSCVTMNPQLVASAFRPRSHSSSPRANPNPLRTPPREPSIIHKLASTMQSHFESLVLVGKVFPVPGRAIRNRLKSDWKHLQEDISMDHIGKDWYKIEFYFEEDVDYVLKHRPWFVQGQTFALQRWPPDFSPFHAIVESIVCFVRIPFLPLHYKDPEVLSDMVSILGTLISIDQASMVGKQSMFVRVCLEVDLTKALEADVHRNNFDEEAKDGNTQDSVEKYVGWTVVSSGKGKTKEAMRDGRTFIEVARGIKITEGKSGTNPNVFFQEAGPSGVDKRKKLVEKPSLSQEAYSSSNALAFQSPKKRTRELFEEV